MNANTELDGGISDIQNTLNESIDAVRVAAGLGMTVPAIEGMLVWVGQLHGPSVLSASGHKPYVYTAPVCTSRESVETYLVNHALREMVSLDENPSPWMPDGWDYDAAIPHGGNYDDVVDRANEYVATTTNEQILKDYEKHCGGTFVIWQERIVANPESRGTIEHYFGNRLSLHPFSLRQD